MSTYVTRQLRPNLVLINQRKSAGWESRRRAARELYKIGQQAGIRETPSVGAIEKAMYRHETGRVAVTDPIYRRLYCLAYGASPHDLFGELDGGEPRSYFSLRSHKFVPAYVGPRGVQRLRERRWLRRDKSQWEECYAAPVDHPEGRCQLYVWPCGVAVFHLVEDLRFSTIAELAAWRKVSYSDNTDWAGDELSRDVGSFDTSAIYVLGAHWVIQPAWPPDKQDTALRILSTPSILLHRDRELDVGHLAHAELVEQSLLAEGYDHAGIESFGVRGISYGYASWSGVVYLPMAQERSLTESELVSCELAMQAAWAYTGAITRQIERGVDPEVPNEYGWRYLRGVRSRLTTSRARETGQHQSMRCAILRTSDLLPSLSQGIDTLCEMDRGRP